MPGAPRKYKVEVSNHENREARFLNFGDAVKWAKRELAVNPHEKVTVTDTKSKVVLWNSKDLTKVY